MNQFNSKNLVEAVTNSRYISTLPAEEASNIKWLLFNAPENLQKQFFKILIEENELSEKVFNEGLKVTKSYLEQYNNENKALHSKLLGEVSKLNEIHARKGDQSTGDSLLISL